MAFSKNALFDGNGKLIRFDKFVKANSVNEEDEYGIILTKVTDALQAVFRGEDTAIDADPDKYDFENDVTEITVTEDYFDIRGINDGPFEGIDPDIATNMFSMKEEKYYFLYVDDKFGQHTIADSSKLYIDLKQVPLE